MPADELCSPVGGNPLPGSIEERLELYERRVALEEEGVDYRIFRQKFLNYRLRFGWVKEKKRVLPSYITPYSTLKRRYTKGRVDFVEDGTGWFNREEIRFITLEHYNRLSGRGYGSLRELLFAPPPLETDMAVREGVGMGPWDLSALIVLHDIPQGSMEIFIESETYPDVREKLVVL